MIIFEPYFDQSVLSSDKCCTFLYRDRYISNIEMAGGTIKYVALQPPKDAAMKTSSAANWTINMQDLRRAINAKTKMIVRLHILCHVHRILTKLR